MKKIVLTLLLLFFCIISYSKPGKATIVQSKTTMKTYGFSDPDPIANPYSKYYPYWRFSQFESVGEDKEWTTVTLENDYIKLTMFPEIGGKIWGAIDKTRNKEFVYYNNVVKFRDIAMRGAWVSGGIEFNFGIIGHIPTTATPVNYKTSQNPDGSVSYFVSSYELITRTFWTVEVNLPADKAYFTTSVTWSNTSLLEQPYYQWMNAAFKADGDITLCSPGDSYIGHPGDAHSYPVDENNHNMKRYKELTFGHDVSIHILGEFGNYYGAYWADENFGFAHCCRQDEKLGRKFFSWSQAREGEIWKDLLTDNHGQYVEIQSGRMYNQPVAESMLTPYKHHTFAPMGTDKWTEYWYPVENIGAYSDATKIGAITVSHKDDSVFFAFSPTVSGEKELKVYKNEELIYQSNLSLEPLHVLKRNFKYAGKDYLKFVVGDGEMVYDEDPSSRKTERPLRMPEDFRWDSPYGHYLLGEQYLNIRDYPKAIKQLDSCLNETRYFVPALNKRALIELHLGNAEKAAEYLKASLSVNTYDGEANYLWGMANYLLQKSTVAKDGFSVATFSQEYRSASYTMLATISMNEVNLKSSLEYVEKALCSQPDNIQALQLKCVILRKTGKVEEESVLLDSLLKYTPLNQILRYELYLLGRISETEYKSEIRCEMPQQDLLETALWYVTLGQNKEAGDICDMTDFPIAKYLKGYLYRNTDAKSSKALVDFANSSSVSFVFPFRGEILKVLQWAESVSPSWKINYYKALIKWNQNDTVNALENLNKCDDSDYAPLFVSRSYLKHGEEKLKDLLRAEQLDDNSWRTADKIIEYYLKNCCWDKACSLSDKYFKKYPDKYEIGLKYANALCESGQYEKSIDVLGKFRVLPNEGASTGHVIFRKANLKLACKLLGEKKYSSALKAVENSKIWNENLGVGKPYEELIDYTTENAILNAIKEKKWQMADSIVVK